MADTSNAELIARLRALRLHDTADDRETVTLPIALEAADALAAADAKYLALAEASFALTAVDSSLTQARRDALEEAAGWAMTLAILIVILEDAFFRQLLATCR